MAEGRGIEEQYSLKIEAQEVIKEIGFAVKHVRLSESIKSTDEQVFFNLETKESECFCVELTPKGFRLVGRQFDVVEDPCDSQYYETIYSLLDSISPQYRNTFSDALILKLQGLQNLQHDSQMEDS